MPAYGALCSSLDLTLAIEGPAVVRAHNAAMAVLALRPARTERGSAVRTHVVKAVYLHIGGEAG